MLCLNGIVSHDTIFLQGGKQVPKNIQITKEMILDAAFNIVKERGLLAISNRTLAKELKCSIRPIYYQFKNTEELNKELKLKIEKYFYNYIMSDMVEGVAKYKQTGLNYIKFAKEEKELFKVLFMSKYGEFMADFLSKDIEEFKELCEYIKISSKLDDSKIIEFHKKMWIFTHGIATLIASENIKISDNEIADLLTYEFTALVEKERG